MPKNWHKKSPPKLNISVRHKNGSLSSQGKVRVRFIVATAAILTAAVQVPIIQTADAASCPDLKIVFARGSGGERWADQNYLSFRDSLDAKLKSTHLDYEFLDLDYQAIGIGDLTVLTGAYLGAGETYAFGESVNEGVSKLTNLINSDKCSKTKYVIGGYSQGAMVVSKAIHGIRASKVLYAATFGDPKIFLPEGKSYGGSSLPGGGDKNVLHTGTLPDACKNLNLSEYRLYVPDCYAYEGALGSYQPYQPSGWSGKLGTWCNGKDIFCSSYLSITDHVSYVRDNLYEDAAKVIYAKIREQFGLSSGAISAHNTAILIDSTGSMAGLINEYKAEALNLANQTFESGGKVALYDYRDIRADGYEPREHCNFETCTAENFAAKLDEITVDGGGDTPESLLYSSFQVMKELNWEYGATKSLVVLTDADYHSPDFDSRGTTFLDVVNLSRTIDPVNFYIITREYVMPFYEDLARETDGAVVSSASDLSILTRDIMERYDSLPRVEVSEEITGLPTVEVLEVVDNFDSVSLKLALGGGGTRVLVAVNDAVLGVYAGEELTISELDRSVVNEIRLVALSEERRGAAATVELGALVAIPKVPDTGRV